ncbi:NAPDH-dependent diflavin reductase [Coemansia helicoidea]|uniref:NAPDH-dependent diflavin reductase n=1 Tax=Coemansia helicoidea TaxID=1286919 RepID=A0ACC1KXP2_9FUNG|nr:NAPDH-dependent diflavin reductase [Coemansia helicoidea]
MAEADRDRRLLVLYGSQTGYAKDTAQRIARQGWRRHFAVQVQAMDEADRAAVLAAACPVIFVCSTTGQGDEPDNMRRFWRFLLRKSHPHNVLAGMAYAVFGQGDSSYQKFNFCAKRLFRRLAQLGARPIVPCGLGDDQHYLGVDGALDPWLEELWSALLDRLPLPRPIIPDSVAPDPSADITPVDGSPGDEASSAMLPPDSHPAVLVASDRLTAPDHFQDVRSFRFELEAADERPLWSPGDCAVLRPANQAADVDAFLAMMGWADRADAPLRATARSGSAVSERIPEVTTLRWLFTHYFDITAVPRRSFFEMLYYFSASEDEKERLREFSATEGQDELHTYCMRPRRTIMEVLDDLPHSRVPLGYVFDVFPEIAERSFSISSAAAATPSLVELTVAVVEYKTLMQRPRVGLCTRWLAHLPIGHRVAMRFARGTMRLPDDPAVPVIMVGPGTGVAPFMAFLRQRCVAGARSNYLFFGCRGRERDFLHRRQLEEWVADGSLRLFCAFSRDQEDKVYVQHRIREHGDLVWSLISEKGAAVFVSGNANRMPDDVRQAFADVVQSHAAGSSDSEAAACIQRMAKAGRYQEECWY